MVRRTVASPRNHQGNNTKPDKICRTATESQISSGSRLREAIASRGLLYRYMDGRCKSLQGSRYAQVFANKDFFAIAYPIAKKSSAGDSLRQFIHEFGRPEKLTYDGSLEQNGPKAEFMSNVRKYAIDHHTTEPYRPNHNFAEGVIREVRRKWFRVMVRKVVPHRLWDYGLQ